MIAITPACRSAAAGAAWHARALLVAGLVGLGLAGGAAAENRQFGGLIYPVPEGWAAPVLKDGLIRMWSDLPQERCEYCTLIIGPEAPKSGSLTDWLTANRLAMVDEEDPGDWRINREAQLSRDGDRYPTAILGQTDGRDLQMLIAIEAGARYFLIGFQGDADEDRLQDSLAVAGETMPAWMAQMRFVPDGAKPLLLPPRAGPMEGLWWGWRMDQSVGIDGMMRLENRYRRMVFWPDGSFYEGTPPEGMAAPDRAALAAARNIDWGNYFVDGNQLKLRFADGRGEVLARDGAGWKDEDQTLNRAEVLADGTRIDGRLEWVNFTGFAPGSGISGGVGGGGETVFYPDGRYEGSSFGGGFGSFDAGGGFAVNSPASRGGTYAVRDGLVIFTPAGGKGQTAEMLFRTDGGEVMVGDDFLKGTVDEGG